MTYKDTLYSMLSEYPKLFPNALYADDHLFARYGTEFSWIGGQLVEDNYSDTGNTGDYDMYENIAQPCYGAMFEDKYADIPSEYQPIIIQRDKDTLELLESISTQIERISAQIIFEIEQNEWHASCGMPLRSAKSILHLLISLTTSSQTGLARSSVSSITCSPTRNTCQTRNMITQTTSQNQKQQRDQAF